MSAGPTYMAKVAELAPAVQVVAAIGAALRLRGHGDAGPSEVSGLLDAAMTELGLPSADSIDGAEAEQALAMVEFQLRHALELLGSPRREPGWNHADLELIEAQGIMSRWAVPAIAAAAALRPGLAQALSRPGTFLDVGTGVARLAIEAARTWPALRVVGIDIWEPALARARRNVAEADLETRVEIRAQDVLDLPDRHVHAVAWLPVPFFRRDVLGSLLAGVRDALVPGGWIVAGVEALPAEPAARTLTMLRTIRGGGSVHTAGEIAAHLRSVGFVNVECVPAGRLQLAIGQRPEPAHDRGAVPG